MDIVFKINIDRSTLNDLSALVFRFAVNLVISGHDDDDIALHFNPRFDVNYCVRNSCRNKVWGEEEKAAYVSNPFKLGENFVLEIFCAPSEFMVRGSAVKTLRGNYGCIFL